MKRSPLLAISVAIALAISITRAHEVRPAFLEITEQPDHAVDVLWKQPRRGETAARLVPHLGNGWLDIPPTEVDANPAFAIKIWKGVRTGPQGLAGSRIAIEGLEATLTDVLVDIRFRDGGKVNAVLRPRQASLAIGSGKPTGLPVPAYLILGVEHILTGIDHLLFVFGLLLLVRSRWRLLQTITAFTVAHSLTLAATALGFLRVRSSVVEVLVALSIVFLAVELVHGRQGRPGLAARFPWIVAFSFGLLHGMAFAGALAEIGLPPGAIPQSLLLFNLGVEAGQLLFVAAVVAIAWGLRRLLPRGLPAWTGWIPSYGMGSFAAFWFIQRFAILWP